jgi:hypothetical protein
MVEGGGGGREELGIGGLAPGLVEYGMGGGPLP